MGYETYFESDYFEMAYEEYKNFKKTREYDEQYKYAILSELNEKIRAVKIEPSTVVEVVKIYQKSNPQAGSFVHWSNLSDLLTFAEEQPRKVAELIVQLFNESTSVNERIDRFYQEGKEYNPKINLGTPLFGYLLAGYDCSKYPIYKDGVFTDLFKSLQISEKPVNIADKYTAFYEICHDIQSFMEKPDNNVGILDAQDFAYSISQYPALKVRIAVHYIHHFAKQLDAYRKDARSYLNEIKTMDRSYLVAQHNNYKNTEKINRIRYLVIDRIINDEPLSLEDFHQIQEDVNKEYETNILQSWGDFTILFHIYYNQYKEKVRLELKNIHQEIRETEVFTDSSFKKDKAINDFSWKNNFGSSDTWLAVYSSDFSNHKVAPQLFLRIDESEIEYGLVYGSNLPELRKSNDTESVNDINDFSFERLKDKLIEVYPEFKVDPVLENGGDGEGNERDGDREDGPPGDPQPTLPLEVDFATEINTDHLYFPNLKMILRQVKTALKNEKHIIFTGPPGTGKSKLAKAISEQLNGDYMIATGTSDWSTFETIGGYRPDREGYLQFTPGIFLHCFKKQGSNHPRNKWLIIDELNRADIDKAFGALFSVLTGDSVTLPFQSQSGETIQLVPQTEGVIHQVNDYEFIIPKDWRMIGTMNTLDKASLYEMSYAFMRRFAFIPIPVPKNIDDTLVRHYLEVWGIDDHRNIAKTVSAVWKVINQYRQIGPAIVEDIVRYLDTDFDLSSAIALYVFPQLEGLMDDDIRSFIAQLSEIEEIDHPQLQSFAGDFFA